MLKTKRIHRLQVAALAAMSLLTFASELTATMSSQGYTGFINVPTPFTSDEAHLELQYNDQVGSTARPEIATAKNFLFSIGMTPWLELGGRLTDRGPPGYSTRTYTFALNAPKDRDLSAQGKLQLLGRKPWPALAVGFQDFGGNGKFRSEYLVAGQRHRWFEYAVGFGQGRLDGPFYGVGLNLGKHAQIQFDDDSRQRSFGLRVDTGDWLRGVQFNAYWRFDARGPDAESFFGVGARIPLGGWAYRPSRQADNQPATKADKRAALAAAQRPVRWLTKKKSACVVPLNWSLDQLALERVAVSRDSDGEDRLFIRYEGRAYPRSEVDALGVVLGEVVDKCAETPPREVVINALHNGQAKYWVAVEFDQLRAWYTGQEPQATPTAGFGYGKPAAGLPVVPGSSRKTWAEIAVDPVINYVVGSEFGAFDYSFGFETNVRIPLWNGAEFTARRRDHVENSDDYEFGSRFFLSNIQTGWDSFLFQQLIRPHEKLLLAGYYGSTEILGFDAETYGGELAISPLESGKLQLYSKFIRYDKGGQIFDNLNISQRDSWSGTLRYFSPAAKAAIDLTWGQFIFEDEGMRVTLRRYFGDTHVGLVYKATRDFESEAVGFSFSMPLTPSRSKSLGPLQFQGSPNWTTFIQTLINQDVNFLSPNLIVEILPGNNIQTDYFDRGRLSGAYINASWERMREAHRRLALDKD